jgi:hypothetical protein
MNAHLNIFNNYREDYNNPLENNLTRAFIITLKNEPNLLRDFMYLISNEMVWDEIFVSIQDKNKDVGGFKRIIGLALTSEDIPQKAIDQIAAHGSTTPIPDFLIYNGSTLIVGEVKKHSENPIAQLKNQLNYMISNSESEEEPAVVQYQALSWTVILTKLIIPHINYNQRSVLKPLWALNFKEYIATHYTDWLPVPTLDKIDFKTETDSVTNTLIEKRLYSIQSLTRFGTPQYWVGGRITLPLNFGWATEAHVILTRHHNKNLVQVTIWPADTKAQGHRIFSRSLDWVKSTELDTPYGKFKLDINPYIKFSHVMGKWIGAINFYNDFQAMGKAFHNQKNFERYCRSWDRSEWTKLTKMFDDDFSKDFEWRDELGWDDKFEISGRNFVFISMGFECNTFIPFEEFQKAEKSDPSGKQAAALLETTIESFQKLVNQ